MPFWFGNAMAEADSSSFATENTSTTASRRVMKFYASITTTNDKASLPTFVSTDNSNKSPFDLPLPSSSSPSGVCSRLLSKLDPTDWLVSQQEKQQEQGYRRWDSALLVREFLYNPLLPEFTALQLHSWAVILGAIMGLYTFLWKMLIEAGIEFVWAGIPQRLYELGYFTDADGYFPLYHYMWIVPMFLGGVLSYLFAVVELKIPDQNAWITCVHQRGMQDYEGFWTLFLLSTLGMLSGLSLGPELPLVLTGSMVGAWFSKLCNQSILQARVLSLTSASAAVGGFFGFPMAGAFFVLELPHRMGMQYFEAMGPSVLASIVAVLMNRWLSNEEFLTGYFQYPALTESLPSGVFTFALVLGLFGTLIGIAYAKSTKQIKTWVHDWFRAPSSHIYYHLIRPTPTKENWLEDDDFESQDYEEHDNEIDGHCCDWLSHFSTLFPHCVERIQDFFERLVIPPEGGRSAIAGAIAGALVGIIAMFLPHVSFWGEAQLQNLIDRGLSPLPIFGEDEEATSAMMANGFCLSEAGFGAGCAVLIALAKVVVIGLSLGTGILGGHFWGPLYVGCAAAHVYTDVVNAVADMVGYGHFLAAYPALVILCFMGSAHVVTFRAHIAIILILTLTISSFGSSIVAKGDYAVVLPLLVIAVFVAGIVSRNIVFYKTQRSRGDLIAVPEVLCQPGLTGRPLVVGYVVEDGDAHPSYQKSSYQKTGFGSDDGTESVRYSVHSTRSSKSRSSLFPVPTFGELTDHQPDLLEQSRLRSASSTSSSLRSLSVRTDSCSSSREFDCSETIDDLQPIVDKPEVDLSQIDRSGLFAMASHGGFVLNV